MDRPLDSHEEEYECFGIPASVFVADEEQPSPAAPLPGATRRNWVTREMALLGVEALPSTLFDADAPALGY